MCLGNVDPRALAAASPILSLEKFGNQLQEGTVRKTVYFVRHGKAFHNICEEQVKERAAAEAETLGHCKGSEAFEAYLKEARLAALSDESLRDPGLCDLGRSQAEVAREAIEKATQGAQSLLPKPTAILVSPLFRTLQTAAAVFPDHPNIRVCRLLRERRTGLPCDEVSSGRSRSSSEVSHIGLEEDFDSGMDSFVEAAKEEPASTPGGSEPPVEGARSEDTDPGDMVEDPPMLRVRTACLAQVLQNIEDDAICVVSHKGWLREFERGPLNRPLAEEFKPGEVRAFEVTVCADGSLETALCHDINSLGRQAVQH